jgi:hypothetical protein
LQEGHENCYHVFDFPLPFSPIGHTGVATSHGLNLALYEENHFRYPKAAMKVIAERGPPISQEALWEASNSAPPNNGAMAMPIFIQPEEIG